ncbi:pyridoxal phosphate-dependent aminotransferase [Spirochaetia bacterium 38H-sp]|uniref:Pyridoxal phosphate-dependent aminotransferase n=1 Tax=Rarispira pelagica TaxID=3141764 RepID=A0ABU9UA07_9SPIR
MRVKFSDRFEYPFFPNRLFELASSAEGYVNLTISNPTTVGLPYEESLLDVFLERDNLVYRPDARGLERARRAVAEYYNRRNLSVSADDVLITAGTGDAYSYLFKMLCNAYDNVLVPQPGYPLFDHIAALELVELRKYELDYSHSRGWRIDFFDLEKKTDNRTRAIVLINPNNPTGSYVCRYEAESLARFASERGIALIVDEVFFDFCIGFVADRASFVASTDCLSFTLSGFSKILGLPQVKFSWIVTSGPSDCISEAKERLELISDTYLSASVPVQNAAPALFTAGHPIFGAIKERINENYVFLDKLFADSAVRLLRTYGGWSCVLELPRIMSEEEWTERLLLEAGVLVYPGYFFDFIREAYIVISLLPEHPVLREGIGRFVDFCKKHGIM